MNFLIKDGDFPQIYITLSQGILWNVDRYATVAAIVFPPGPPASSPWICSPQELDLGIGRTGEDASGERPKRLHLDVTHSWNIETTVPKNWLRYA